MRKKFGDDNTNERERDLACAKIILGDIGGRDSEMSELALCFYASVVCSKWEELSQMFRGVASDELRHVERLSRLAFALGGDPRLCEYRGRRRIYWSPGANRYRKKPRDLISEAMMRKYIMLEKYSKQLKTLSHPAARETLAEIIADEQRHLQIFKQMIAKI